MEMILLEGYINLMYTFLLVNIINISSFLQEHHLSPFAHHQILIIRVTTVR